MEMFRKTSILKHFFYFLIEIKPIHCSMFHMKISADLQ